MSTEVNQGELKVKFEEPVSGKVSFEELGLMKEDLYLEGGTLRLVFDMSKMGEHNFYQVPTVEVAYKENMSETHWQCDFNGETILDKNDHHGHSTVMLLNRNKLADLEQHHENNLVIHAEFPEPAHLDAKNSYIHFFK